MKDDFDFGGWATKINIKCADGRTIRDGAFKDCDGKTVPLVWMHQHNNAENVLGHALLEYRPGAGMYTYGKFNDTEQGRNAKALVDHGDVTAISIYANQLKQNGGDVMHGNIREVSLVLAGANPGAFIDFVSMAHGEESEEEGVVYTDELIELAHSDEELDEEAEGSDEVYDEDADEDSESYDEDEDSWTDSDEDYEEPEDGIWGEEPIEHAGIDVRTLKDVFDELTDEQKDLVYFLVGRAVEKYAGNDISGGEE